MDGFEEQFPSVKESYDEHEAITKPTFDIDISQGDEILQKLADLLYDNGYIPSKLDRCIDKEKVRKAIEKCSSCYPTSAAEFELWLINRDEFIKELGL